MATATYSVSEHPIDAKAIVTLIFFILANILVIWPRRIPLPLFVQRTWGRFTTPRGAATPRSEKRWHVPIGLATAPVIAVLILLASTCIPGSVVRDGIVGSGGIRPYDVMTLFTSFAYIALSLDCTGLLRYLAFRTAARFSSSGRTLFFALYAFFATTGLVTGNDPLTLSGTPFLAYFTDHAGIAPATAYFFSHFQVANLASALLVSSNPTNLVLTAAFNLSFLRYSAWLALPTVAGLIVLFPILRWVLFRGRMIPKTLDPPIVNPRAALVDPWGAVFGASLFIITIVALVVLSTTGLLEGTEGVWTVTAPAAILMLLRDMWRDKYVQRRERRNPGCTRVGQDQFGVCDGSWKKRQPSPSPTPTVVADPASTEEARETITLDTLPVSPADKQSGTASANAEAVAALDPQAPPPSSLPWILQPMRRHFPTVTCVLLRMPFPLIPFAFSMFILVEALQYTGWIRVFGGWWTAWAKVGGLGGCVWLMGTIGVLGCNVFGTNIGATVLLSRVLQHWQSTSETVTPRTLYGSVFALALGSNFGAYSFVFSASLAGLLWRNILDQKGFHITLREFIKWNTVPVIVTMVVGCLVVVAEVCVIYR